MITVGAIEAKSRWDELLDRVAKGEKITIARRRVPVAVLVPVSEGMTKLSHDELVRQMRALRNRVRLDKMSVREMIKAHRRSDTI